MLGRKGQIGAFLAIVILICVIVGIIFYLDQTKVIDAEPFYIAVSEYFGIPKATILPPQLIYFVILPYVTTVFIIFGILMELGIFRHVYGKKRDVVYLIIAATWAMLLLPTGILGWLATILYSMGAIFAIIAFVGLFIAGSFIWMRAGIQRIKGTHGVIGDLYNERRDLEARLRELAERYASGRITADAYRTKRLRIQARINWIDERIRTLEKSVAPEKKPKL